MIRITDIYEELRDLAKKYDAEPTAIGAELISSLTDESIHRGYATTIEKNSPNEWSCKNRVPLWMVMLMLCMLQSLCQDYIRGMNLSKDDAKYKKLVDNLSLLSALTNRGVALTDEEMEYCIDENLIPCNLDGVASVDIDWSEPVHFITKQRIDELTEFMFAVLYCYSSIQVMENKGEVSGLKDLSMGKIAEFYQGLNEDLKKEMNKDELSDSRKEKTTLNKLTNSLEIDL